MAEGGEDLSKVSGGGGGGKEDPDPKTHHAASTKSGKKARRKKKHKGGGGGGGTEGVDSGVPPPLPAKRGAEGGGGGGGLNVSSISTKSLQQILNKLSLEEKNRRHDFWDTQPVPKLEEKVEAIGPLEADRDEIRPEPLSLPDNFTWDDIDLLDDAQLDEVYMLLNENYVEDEDNMFRFDYSRMFLRWALMPPGWKKVWHCGVRVTGNRKLVGFISAVPAVIKVMTHQQQMVEINFLCVHKKLRSKRVAPVLIKEITRRVNLEGIFQAVYTAGVLLPKPISVCQYWHRSLNPKKLVEVRFSALQRHMTLQRMIKLYRLPEVPKTAGLRPFEKKDIPAVFRKLTEYLERFEVVPIFQSEEEVEHWLANQPEIITCYVVEDPETHEITDMFSFYHLPSTVVSHPVHKSLHVAYAFYYFATRVPLKDLMMDALIIAKNAGADVFNALDLMDNKHFLEDLKFGTGDGNLHYYFYNFKCPEIPPEKVGLVLQ